MLTAHYGWTYKLNETSPLLRGDFIKSFEILKVILQIIEKTSKPKSSEKGSSQGKTIRKQSLQVNLIR